jgi:uncharacterized membrane protein HdeD (DUF308 family)
MSTEGSMNVACSGDVAQEFQHLRLQWFWLFLYGVLLTACGTAAVIFPPLTILTTFAVMVLLGVSLMIAGIATIIAALWAGKWSGLLVEVLVGILYIMVGFVITDTPAQSAVALTLIVAAFLIVVGLFRSVAALLIRHPYWGWSLLNGVVTFLLGVIIYHHFPQGAIWIVGLLVGLEMLFHGWTWILLSLAVRKIPTPAV